MPWDPDPFDMELCGGAVLVAQFHLVPQCPRLALADAQLDGHGLGLTGQTAAYQGAVKDTQFPVALAATAER